MEHRVNSIHKRALKLVYKDFSRPHKFQELPDKDNSVIVHQKMFKSIFKSEN